MNKPPKPADIPPVIRETAREPKAHYKLQQHTKKGNKMHKYKTLIAEAVNKSGGFYEKDIMAHSPVFFMSHTWNNEHKVIKVIDQHTKKYFNFDIVTMKIC